MKKHISLLAAAFLGAAAILAGCGGQASEAESNPGPRPRQPHTLR